jgi:4-coumarate--CoA ligase
VNFLLSTTYANSCIVIYLDPVTNRSHTYATIESISVTFGKSLMAIWGWKKGDVLVTYTPHSINFPAVVWGTHWAGGIICPASHSCTAEELGYQLKRSHAKALATHESLLGYATKAAAIAGMRVVYANNMKAFRPLSSSPSMLGQPSW